MGKIDLSLCVDRLYNSIIQREADTALGLTGVDITRLQPGSDSNMTRMNGWASRPS